MSKLLSNVLLDNANESRRSFASTAFAEELPGWDEWYAQAHPEPTPEEEEAAYQAYVADCARCEAAAVAAAPATPARPALIECECGFSADGVWVKSPRTGRKISIPSSWWASIFASIVITARRAASTGKTSAGFTPSELRRLVTVRGWIDAGCKSTHAA